jgi:hypothetical protein
MEPAPAGPRDFVIVEKSPKQIFSHKIVNFIAHEPFTCNHVDFNAAEASSSVYTEQNSKKERVKHPNARANSETNSIVSKNLVIAIAHAQVHAHARSLYPFAREHEYGSYPFWHSFFR